MRILVIGAGGVGDAFARIAARREFFEALVVADYDLARAERTVAAVASATGTSGSSPPRWMRPTRARWRRWSASTAAPT